MDSQIKKNQKNGKISTYVFCDLNESSGAFEPEFLKAVVRKSELSFHYLALVSTVLYLPDLSMLIPISENTRRCSDQLQICGGPKKAN